MGTQERTRACVFDVVDAIKNVATILALLASACWAIFVIGEPLQSELVIREKELSIRERRIALERGPSLEIEMETSVVGSTSMNNAHIVVYVSMKNLGLDKLEIHRIETPVSIRIVNDDGSPPTLLDQLPTKKYGESIEEARKLILEANDKTQLSFLYGIDRSGVYIVVFEIPVSDTSAQKSNGRDQGSWWAQEFVVVD